MMTEDMKNKPLSEYTDEEREEFMREIEEHITPEQREALVKLMSAMQYIVEWYESPDTQDTRERIAELISTLGNFMPELEKELHRLNPDASNMTLDEALNSGILDAALSNLAERTQAPTLSIEAVTSTDFPLDKVNTTVWKLLEEAREGQLAFNIGVESEADKRAGNEINILYGIEFDGLEELENVKITRKLEPYDKRVYIAIGAIFKAGYDYMSYQQIYNAMRYTGRAGAGDLKKIHAAVSKMNGAKIYVDNLEESSVYRYDHFRYDGSLLPMERATAIVNGQLAESVIHVFREPPLLTLARERKQITTIERKLLATPLSMTNANIQLEDYLIERISRMKRGAAQCKMLFETIYRNAGITTTKQKQRAWPKIEKLLKHYKECGFIAGFEREKDGVRIAL